MQGAVAAKMYRMYHPYFILRNALRHAKCERKEDGGWLYYKYNDDDVSVVIDHFFHVLHDEENHAALQNCIPFLCVFSL